MHSRQGRSDGHLSPFAFGWLLGSHGDVVRLCTCGLSGSGGRLSKKGAICAVIPSLFSFLVDACTFDPHRFIHSLNSLIIDLNAINRDWTGIDTLLSLISLIYLVYICSLVCKCVNKPFYNRRDLSSKVGIGAAYKIVNSHGRNGDTDEVDIRFDSGCETESSNKG